MNFYRLVGTKSEVNLVSYHNSS